MAGKRISKGKPVYRRRGKRIAPGREAQNRDKALLRLLICGAAFVLLVAVKLLFPQSMDSLSRTVGEWMERDSNFKEAFAAVGRAVSGKDSVGDSLQDAYTAVFRPEGVRLERTVAVQTAEVGKELTRAERLASLPLELPLGDWGTGELLQRAREKAELAAEEEKREETVPTVEEGRVYAMDSPPANASLELRDLEFEYRSPLSGTLTSTFGWRKHPVNGGNKFHYGVDLAAEAGEAICAFADGVVYATGESSTLGKYIMLEHSNGYKTLYAHCSAVTRTGGRVAAGDKIAEVGETGTATGPHLHFELHDGALYLNPIYYVEVQ